MEEDSQSPYPINEGMGSIDLPSGDGGQVDFPPEVSDPLVRDFLDMVDLYQTMRAVNLNSSIDCDKIRAFCGKYETIGKGCGCQKNKRLKNAEEAYLDIVNLRDSEGVKIKEALNVNKLRLFFNGGLFAEI